MLQDPTVPHEVKKAATESIEKMITSQMTPEAAERFHLETGSLAIRAALTKCREDLQLDFKIDDVLTVMGLPLVRKITETTPVDFINPVPKA
ncbi:MAG: hypothetical protein ACRCR2_02445 [Fusobacteriaceae bacterium]